MGTVPKNEDAGQLLSEFVYFLRFIPSRRWLSLVVILLATNGLFLGILLGVNGDHGPDRPFIVSLVAMWAHGEIIGAALIMNLMVVAVMLSGPGANLHAIRTRFGAEASATLYHGTWVFSRPRRWYFAAYEITDQNGIRQAVLTLGADIKEVISCPSSTAIP